MRSLSTRKEDLEDKALAETGNIILDRIRARSIADGAAAVEGARASGEGCDAAQERTREERDAAEARAPK
jgi:hypothetical protein